MGLLKLAVPLLLFDCLLSSQARSQHVPLISLSEKNVTLKKAMEDLRHKTGYTFFGESNWTSSKQPVNFSVHRVPIGQALDSIFRDQPFVYELINNEATNSIAISIQPRPVKDRLIHGWVFNERREPLSGVTILLQNGSASAVTRDNGEFTIRTHYTNSRLLISSVNYQSQELLQPEDERDLEVHLTSRISELADVTVVHTGYQDEQKNKTTGSFDELNHELINRRVSTNILDRIDGVASSVLFNKNTVSSANPSAIAIRGRSTIFANPNPLIVIDNFPYNGDINNINPDDVESITVLKDAAAASIWGAFSGNGVIVITTKKGKLNQEPKISFNTSQTVSQKPNLYYPKVLSSGDYIDVEQNLYNAGYYAPYLGSLQYPVVPPVVEILDQEYRGLLSGADATAQIEALRKVDVRRDLDKYFYRNAVNSQYSLNVSGGGPRNQYYFSAGYDHNLTSLVRNNYNRVTLNGNNVYQIVPGKLELTTGLAFTASTTTTNNQGGNAGVIYPYAQLADAHGNALPVAYGLRLPYADTAGGGQLLDWHYRPLDELRNADNTSSLTDYRINIGLKYTIWKGLNAQAFYQFGHGTQDIQQFQSQQTWYTRNLINSYAQDSSGVFTFPVPKGGILQEYMNDYTANNVRLQLNYSDTVFSGRVNIIGGGEVRDIEGDMSSSTLYGYDKDLGSSIPVNYVTTYPNFTTGIPTNIPYQDSKMGTAERYISYYLNGDYTYLDRYILSASIRRDESNIFGVRTNQKGVPLWSVGGGWQVSKEDFYRSSGVSRWLPYLKLRVTDGYNGNVDRSVSAFTTANIYPGINNYGQVTAGIVNPPNPALRWERINVFNTGLDFAMRGNRVGGSIEYYIKSGQDLIANSPLDPTTGIDQFTGNTANMMAHGIDLTLHTDNDLGAVHWNSVLLFSMVRDKVTAYREKPGAVQDYMNTATLNPLVGNPLYSVYALRWRGLDSQNGNPQGWLGGHLSEDYGGILGSSILSDLVYKGPANPPVFGSWRNTFSWRQWGVSFNILYKLGYVFRRPSIFYTDLFSGASGGHPDYEQRWQKPGDEKITNVPSMIDVNNRPRDNFYQYSEELIEKGDHIRLQDIQLSYDLARAKCPGLPVQLVRFYVYANNIGILWKANHAGIDPDYVSGIPNPRTLAGGVKVDF
jgi:TonB-linked SusC/RagA family outer membrane protein